MQLLKTRNKLFLAIIFSALILLSILVYTSFISKKPLDLTDEELRWIREHPVLDISPNPNFAPVEFFEHDTLYQGIASELLKEIATRLHISYRIVRFNNQAEIYEAIQRKETAVLPAVIVTEERKRFLLFTEPYLHLQNVIVVRKTDTTISSVSDLRGKRLAVVRGSSVYLTVQKMIPDLTLVPVNSGLESLFEVSFGRADAAIVNLASASYLIPKHDLANLKVATDYSSRLPIAIAIRPDLPILYSIINKALASIPQSRKNEIINRWLGLQLELEWWMTIPWKWIGAGILFMLVVMIIITYWNRTLQRRIQQQTAKLQESEEKFRRLFTDSPAGMVLLNLNTQFVQWNDVFRQMTGYDDIQLQQILYLDIVHESDRKEVEHIFSLLMSNTASECTLEHRYKHSNRSIRWIETSMRLIRDSTGTPLHYLIIAIDITKRKTIEEENVRFSRELSIIHTLERKVNASLSLDATLDAAVYGMLEASYAEIVFLFLRDGSRLELYRVAPDSEAEKLLKEFPLHSFGECICGLAAKEQKAQYSLNIFNDIRCTWLECKQTGIVSFAGLPLIVGSKVIGVIGLATRREYNFEANARFLETLAGSIAIGIQNAILYTATHRAEEELRKREEELKNIFRASPIGIGVLSRGHISTVNERMVELSEYEYSELLGMPFEKLFPSPSDFFIVTTELQKQREKSDITTVETRLRQKNGKILEVLISLTPHTTNSTHPQDFIFTVLDITPQKVLSRQLAEAQKLESLGTLAGGIAHDFNNILNIIGGYAERLTTHGDNPDQRQRAISIILSSVHRAAKLVQQILTFARRTQHDLTPLNINAIIDELVKMLHETFPKTIELKTELDDTIPMILGNHTQLHQALLNLAVNARDAMPSGGTLTFRTELVQPEAITTQFPQAQATKYICIAVRDTGIGMDSKTLQKIFEPFFTTKEVGKGTGLGLSVVYGIVAGHNGFIDVHSKPGAGTTFYLYFPELQSHTITTIQDNNTYDTTNHETVPATVLVIEDEEPLCELLQQILSNAGYTVLVARDGKEALDVFEKHKNSIDIVLSDLGLPKMSGYECFKEFQKRQPNVRMVVASGYFEPNEKKTMLQSGILGFIQKPYSSPQILSLLKEILNKS